MSDEILINTDIGKQFDVFRDKGLFCDCVLSFQGNTVKNCHRLVLSRFSSWFRKAFMSKSDQCELAEIVLPVNPNEIMTDIIDCLYNGKILVSQTKIASLCYCAKFYDMKIFLMIGKSQFLKVLSLSNAIFLTTEMLSFNLEELAVLISPLFANEMIKFFTKGESYFSLKEIFSTVSPKMFSAILKSEVFNQISYEKKVDLIDQYVGGREIAGKEDQEALASVINWEEEDSHRYFVQYCCDWVPASLSRTFYSKILTIRRNIYNNMVSVLPTNKEDLDHWIPYSWIHYISEAKDFDGQPIVNAVSFLSDFGISKTKINPERFSFLLTDSSKPLSSNYSLASFLMGDSYFLSKTDSESIPYISLEFGANSFFVPTMCEISCEAMNAQGDRKITPNGIVIEGYETKDSQSPLYSFIIKYEELPLENGLKKAKFPPNNKIKRIMVKLEPNSKLGFNIMRITKLGFYGSFA